MMFSYNPIPRKSVNIDHCYRVIISDYPILDDRSISCVIRCILFRICAIADCRYLAKDSETIRFISQSQSLGADCCAGVRERLSIILLRLVYRRGSFDFHCARRRITEERSSRENNGNRDNRFVTSIYRISIRYFVSHPLLLNHCTLIAWRSLSSTFTPPFLLCFLLILSGRDTARYGIKFLKDIPIWIYFHESPLLIPRLSALTFYFRVYGWPS
jgi:hypothetical protein